MSQGIENITPALVLCPHRDFCGGCSYNGEDYNQVLKIKEEEALAQFEEKAGLIISDFDGEYAGIVGCPEDWRFEYRNKMEYTFGDLTKEGPLELGMHKKGNFMSIITTDCCKLVPDDFNKILRYTLDFAKDAGLKHYHKKTHTGVLRNLIIRRGVRTGELLVDIVTSSESDEIWNAGKKFNSEAWKNGLLALELDNDIVGIMHTINDNIADTVNCDEQRILYGRDYYYEEICGFKFKVSIFSFFQTNVLAVERLYNDAMDLIPDLDGKMVYDLFCGTGTISQIAARKAKEVIGIEIVPDSVLAAETNGMINGIENCRFICGDVFDVLTDGCDVERRGTNEDSNNTGEILPAPDMIIVDPPRIGLRTKTVNKIAAYKIPEILYISCNPKTLAMDLADFRTLGYEPKYIRLYDNFCLTKHLESICLLMRKNTV